MTSILSYGRWILAGTWWARRPEGSGLTWGRLMASWFATTFLVAAVFAGLAAGGFVGAVAVALLWVPAQVAVIVGLTYAVRMPRGTR